MNPIKFEQLNSPVGYGDIRNYKKQRKVVLLSVIIQIVILSLILAPLFLYLIESFGIMLDVKSGDFPMPVVYFLILTAIVVVYYKIWEFLDISKKIRYERFADDNNLYYFSGNIVPEKDGLIFSVGHSHSCYDIFRSKNEKYFEIANHRYVVGSGKNQRIIERGYLMLKLNHKLPHMVLDSKENNTNLFGLSISNLPVAFNKSQILSLEGDFDSHFTLYAPKDYERDALYIFSPDLMAQFIDKTGDFDAEIVDDKLYIYSTKPFNYFNISLLSRLFHIINTVMNKTSYNSRNYKDEKVVDFGKSNEQIADSGRRLKKGISISTIILILFLVIYMVYSFIR